MRKAFRRLDGSKLVSVGVSSLLLYGLERLMFWVDVIAIGSAVAGLFGFAAPHIPKAAQQIEASVQQVQAAPREESLSGPVSWTTSNIPTMTAPINATASGGTGGGSTSGSTSGTGTIIVTYVGGGGGSSYSAGSGGGGHQ